MWQQLAESLEPFRAQLPTVALAATCAAILGVARSWRSTLRHGESYGCFWRLFVSLIAGSIAALGATIAAALLVDLTDAKWSVVSGATLIGATVDVTMATGPMVLFEQGARMAKRIHDIWSTPDSQQRQ